jgi:hypothetical protein
MARKFPGLTEEEIASQIYNEEEEELSVSEGICG